MKIWYQSYGRLGDPAWDYYEKALRAHIAKVARPGTVIDLHGVEKLHPKFTEFHYILRLHVSQIIENALRAEREGYDAFISGGQVDAGYHELKEVLNIPVAFLAESSYLTACLLAPKFALMAARNEVGLSRFEEKIKFYGLKQRFVRGSYLGSMDLLDLVNDYTKNPQRVIDTVKLSAKGPIERGAGILIPVSGVLNTFLVDHGITEIDGVPILDSVRVVIETTELLIDLKRNGIPRSNTGLSRAPSGKEVLAAQKLYGVG